MKDKIMKNMGLIITVPTLALYVLLSYVFIDSFQINILQIVVNGAILLVGAVIVNTALMHQGILLGGENKSYQATQAAYLQEKDKVYRYLKDLQLFLDVDYQEMLKKARTNFTYMAGYNYLEVFSEDGKYRNEFVVPKPKKKGIFKYFSEEWKNYRNKKRAIAKARKYKLTRLTTFILLNAEENDGKDPNNYGITKANYLKKNSISSLVSRIVGAILLQSISFGFTGFSLQSFLVQLVNIFLILCSGAYSMYKAYYFVVDKHRQTILFKINKLEEFYNVAITDELENKAENLKEREGEDVCAEIPTNAESGVVETVHDAECNWQDDSVQSREE